MNEHYIDGKAVPESEFNWDTRGRFMMYTMSFDGCTDTVDLPKQETWRARPPLL